MINKVVGDNGEKIASKYLKEKKYKIVKRNYKNKIGEIDIIAEKDNTIIFIEVKTRSTSAYGLGREAVNSYKQNKIRQVALMYLQQNKLLSEKVRFDVIEIQNNVIEQIENAF